MSETEAQRDLDRFEADARWVGEHWHELLAKYADHCIAVYNQEVVGASKDPRQVVEQVKRHGVHPGYVYRKWLSTSDDLLIVPAHTRGSPLSGVVDTAQGCRAGARPLPPGPIVG